jgi:hypothetical protein
MWRTAASVCLCLLHQYALCSVCVCVCVCVHMCMCVRTRVHARVSVMSLLRVYIQVYIWFNMTSDCFSFPFLSFPLYWHHLQICIIMLLHLGRREWWTVWWTLWSWNLVRFEVHSLTAVFLKVFWYVTPDQMVNSYWCSRGAYLLHLLECLTLKLQSLQFFTTTVNI